MENKKDKHSSEKVEKNRKDLLDKLKALNGKTIGQVDQYGLLDNPKNKGDIGQVIQKYLGKDLDNDPGPDFPDAELDLRSLVCCQTKPKRKTNSGRRRGSSLPTLITMKTINPLSKTAI